MNESAGGKRTSARVRVRRGGTAGHARPPRDASPWQRKPRAQARRRCGAVERAARVSDGLDEPLAAWLRDLSRDAAGWTLLVAQGRPLTSRRVCRRLGRFVTAAPLLAQLAPRLASQRAACDAVDAWLFGSLLPHCIEHFDAVDDGEFDLVRHFADAVAGIAASGYAPAQGAALRRAFACLIKACLHGRARSPRAAAAALGALGVGLTIRAIGAATPGVGQACEHLAARLASGELQRLEPCVRQRACAGLRAAIEHGLLRAASDASN
ncbi:hypothetical protein [Caldimonas sp. KR1-144]|uniref:hypothetical protein n=1 Tax=Caldimonas sp. KR1-144 TaxID=3400911 RepID=UPI003C0F0AD0